MEYYEYSPEPHTMEDWELTNERILNGRTHSSYCYDAKDGMIMDGMTRCQGKPADKLIAAQIYLRLKGYD